MESQLDKASEKAKNQKSAQTKREQRLRKLMGEAPRFADPAAKLKQRAGGTNG